MGTRTGGYELNHKIIECMYTISINKHFMASYMSKGK